MVILGLTGSLGMGKTETARMFRRLGVPVYDADAAVHKLMAKGGDAVAAIAEIFPGVEVGGAIDRKALGARVFGKPDELKKLEAILHPLAAAERQRLVKSAAARWEPLVVLDIPLLFETGGARYCDAVAVVTAPAFLQRQRVLARAGMTPDRFKAVLSHQMPDREKRRRADFIILTGLNRRDTWNRVIKIIEALTNWPAAAGRGVRRR